MRLSTHMYNAPEHVDRVLEILADVARSGIPA
jgi:selenocysteine lyase/cysteine desulfurase